MMNLIERVTSLNNYEWMSICKEDMVNFNDAFLVLNGYKAYAADGILYVYKTIFDKYVIATEDNAGNVEYHLNCITAEEVYSKIECYVTLGYYSAFTTVGNKIKDRVFDAINSGKIKVNRLVEGMSDIYDKHPEKFPLNCKDTYYVKVSDEIYLLVFEGDSQLKRVTYAFDKTTCSFRVFIGRDHIAIVQEARKRVIEFQQVKEFSVDELADVISKFYAYGYNNNIPVQFMPMAVHSLLNSNKDMSLEDVSALMNKLCKGGE